MLNTQGVFSVVSLVSNVNVSNKSFLQGCLSQVLLFDTGELIRLAESGRKKVHASFGMEQYSWECKGEGITTVSTTLSTNKHPHMYTCMGNLKGSTVLSGGFRYSIRIDYAVMFNTRLYLRNSNMAMIIDRMLWFFHNPRANVSK
jgi:hypothetical protein